MARLRREGVEAVCSIVGDGPEAAGLRHLAAEHYPVAQRTGARARAAATRLPLAGRAAVAVAVRRPSAGPAGGHGLRSDLRAAPTSAAARDGSGRPRGIHPPANPAEEIAAHLKRIALEDGLWTRLSRNCVTRHAEMFTAGRMAAAWERLTWRASRSAVAVVLEQRFAQTPNRRVWTDGPRLHSFWQRYLAVFDEVPWWAASGRRPAPAGLGPRRWPAGDLRAASLPWAGGPPRAPPCGEPSAGHRYRRRGDLAGPLEPRRRALSPVAGERGHPYAVEVLGDPYDVFAPGAVRHPLRPWFRAMFVRALRAHCPARGGGGLRDGRGPAAALSAQAPARIASTTPTSRSKG